MPWVIQVAGDSIGNKQKIPPTNPCSCGAFKALETDIKRTMTKLYCILECAIKRHKQKEGVMELGSVCGFKRGYKKRRL